MLSKPDILAALRSGGLRFDPAVPDDAVDQVSVDLRLDRKFSKLRKLPDYMPGIHVSKSLFQKEGDELWDEIDAETYALPPGGFILGQTYEKVCMPNDLAGLVEGRSSFARLGVSVHVTAPKIDPGFQAHIALEMVNFGQATVVLRAIDDKPAQLILFRLSTPLGKSEVYGARDKDIFQNQASPRGRGRKSSPKK